MKNVAWCVCKDEEFYIDMAVLSVVDYVDGIYVLDTGSKDGTLEVLKKFESTYPKKIVVEQKDFGQGRFGIWNDGRVHGWSLFKGVSGFYQEEEARNYALNRVEKLFETEWLLQIDADEIYNRRFWEVFKVVQESPIISTFGFSTLVPLTPYFVSNNPDCLTRWGDKELYDPHVRIWKPKLKVRWNHPAGRDVIPKIIGEDGDLRCDFASTDQVHFHLHRSFGPKAIYAWLTRFGANWVKASEILNVPLDHIFDQKYYEEYFPDWFKDGKFTPPASYHEYRVKTWGAKPLMFGLPEFVVEKWESWGRCW